MTKNNNKFYNVLGDNKASLIIDWFVTNYLRIIYFMNL